MARFCNGFVYGMIFAWHRGAQILGDHAEYMSESNPQFTKKWYDAMAKNAFAESNAMVRLGWILYEF